MLGGLWRHGARVARDVLMEGVPVAPAQEAELTELHARISELEKRRSFARMQIMQQQKGGSVPEKHESGQVTNHSVWNRKGYFCAWVAPARGVSALDGQPPEAGSAQGRRRI